MAEILTLPDDSFHLDDCECGHPRIAHYDEWQMCLEKECECAKFEEAKEEDD